jgi:hypothetical protein
MAIPNSTAPIIVYPLNQLGLNKIERARQGHRDAGHRIVIPGFHRGDGQVMGSFKVGAVLNGLGLDRVVHQRGLP